MNEDDICKNDEDLVLVTGASGYLAIHVVQQLQELGYRVRGTVRSLKNEDKVAPIRNLVKNPKHEVELVEANLDNEESWIDAVKGCKYVIHTASPFPATVPKDENEIITPAVNGTLFVFRACAQPDSTVKKVVLTSSIVAIAPEIFENGRRYTEKDWPDVKTLPPYPKSKALAEKAAWDFLKTRKENGESTFELAVINPGFILGPLLNKSEGTSATNIKKIMMREFPLCPKISIPSVDVRDVALAHIRAMTRDEAVSKRHITVNSFHASSFKDWSLALQKEFKSKNYNPPTREAPNFLFKLAAKFDPEAKQMVPLLGVKAVFENTQMKRNLSIDPIPIEKTIMDMGYSLIQQGLVPKKY